MSVVVNPIARLLLTPSKEIDFKNIVKSIPNLRFWFSAPYEEKVDGDLISSPVDQSGNGVTVASPSDARRPTFKTNIINGQPVYRFDGTTDCWQGTKAAFDFLHKGSSTIILLFNHKASASAYIFDNAVANPVNIGRSIRSLGSNGNFFDACYAASSPNNVFLLQSANGTLPINNWHLTVSRYEAGKPAADDFEMLIDNLILISAQGTLNPSTSTSTNTPTIGGSSTLTNLFNGDIAEIIAFDRALTNDEINKICGGLNFGL